MPYSYKTVHEEVISAVTATPSVSLGSRRLYGGNEYVYAYNGGSAANKGAPVVMTGTSNYTFVVTFATGADIPCTFLGVVQHATCAAGSYCWVVVKGFADVYVVSAAVTIGDSLIVADGGGAARPATWTSQVTQLAKQGTIGAALTAATAAATGTVGVYLR
jgi:hypothetical protein